jgi:hypothetical protein
LAHALLPDARILHCAVFCIARPAGGSGVLGETSCRGGRGQLGGKEDRRIRCARLNFGPPL